MYILNMEIKEDRQVVFSDNSGGNILENNATLLNIRIPKIYSSYYKYLDIVKDNKEKTQTVVSSKDEYILTYLLPDALTGARELTCQLVLKKDAEVFKSNIFKLTFSGSINSTQLIENKNPDTLEFLMENKADRQELIKTEERKLDKNAFYSFRDNQDEINNLKADKEEMDALLAGKVDKAKGKGLSTNDFTTFLKTRLEEGVVDYIGEVSSEDELKDITSYGIHTFTLIDYNATSYDETTVRKNGFLINDSDEYYKITGQQSRTISQYVFYPESRMLKFRTTEDETEWTEFETCGYISEEDFSAELKNKLCNLYSREEIDIIRGNIDEAKGAIQSAHERIDTLSQITDENFGMLVNALEGDAYGERIILTDVTATESNLEITLSGDMEDFSSVNVTARGKNILNPNVYLEPQTQYGVTLKYIPEEDVFCLDGNCITTSTDGAHFTTKLPELIKIDKNKEYIVTVEFVSGTASYSNENEYKIFFTGAGDYEGHKNNYIKGDLKGGQSYAYQPKYDYLTYVWIHKITNGDSFDNFKFRIQVSEKEFYNDYDKWTPEQTVKAQADGTVKGLKSVYPVTFIDTDQEVNINCRYNRDINKAFTELQQAIISLGGNV